MRLKIICYSLLKYRTPISSAIGKQSASTNRNNTGEVEVSFDQANSFSMDYLKAHTNVGESKLLKLGNSRFREAEVNSEIEEIYLDFRCKQLRGARAEVDLEIGEIAVEMPDDVGIKIDLKGGGNFLKENNIDSAFYSRGVIISMINLKVKMKVS